MIVWATHQQCPPVLTTSYDDYRQHYFAGRELLEWTVLAWDDYDMPPGSLRSQRRYIVFKRDAPPAQQLWWGLPRAGRGCCVY